MSSISSSTENEVAMPTALAFLVSNFQSLVTIKLSTDNYLLWKTQVLNALRANGFLDYVKGNIRCPPLQIRDTSNNLITNPAYLAWTLVDNQLLSCLTATLSSSTLPLVLGLEHASDVWICLENRFNSLSRSHLHDLKRTLFSFSKSGTMDQYIDDLKICAQKLSAVGYEVDDDDMVFHAINGLPEEQYASLKQTLRTHRDLKFHELVSILKSEEHQTHKSRSDKDISSVFVGTQKLKDLCVSEVSGSSSQGHSVQLGDSGSSSASVVHSTSMPQSSQSQASTSFQPQVFHPPQPPPQAFQPPHVQMFQPSFPQAPFFPQSGNRFTNNRNKLRGQTFVSFPRPACQICGKDNHSARTCYYRNNSAPGFIGPPAGFSSPGFPGPSMFPSGYQSPNMWRPTTYHQVQMSIPFQTPQFASHGHAPPQFASHGPAPAPSSFMTPGSNTFSAYGEHYPGHISASGSTSGHVPSPGFQAPSAFATYYSPGSGPMNGNAYASSSQNWYLDSGATNHVTSDLNNSTHPQPSAAGTGVMVGNGQQYTSDSFPGTLSSGPLSYSELL